MTTEVSVFNNYARFQVEGQVDLSSTGAVTAYRGDNITVAKTATGQYTVTVKNPSQLKSYETLNTGANLQDTAIGTVKDVGVVSLSFSSSTGNWTFIVRTVDAAGADVDEASSALTVSFNFVVRTNRMTMPFT